MADQLFLRKVSGAAIPADEDFQDIFNKFKIGQHFEVLPWKDRNYLFFKKMFRMVGIVSERNPKWKNRYSLIKTCQFGIGHVVIESDINGNMIHPVPVSLKFKTMKEPEFMWLYREISQYLLTNLELMVPGMPREQFETLVQQILDMT